MIWGGYELFDGLNDINWQQFGDYHLAIGMNTKDIPTSVWKMLDDDAEARENAIQDLLGEGQHLGMIGEATPAIIPYILDVLADEAYAERGYLVFGLSLICENLFRYQSIPYLRLALKTFDAMKEGFPLYKRLLNDVEQETRLYTVAIMGFMQDRPIEALTLLLQRLKIETDNEIRNEIIEHMITLVSKVLSPYVDDGLDTLKSLYMYIKDHASFDEQLIFVHALQGLRFKHDTEIKDFMNYILKTSSQRNSGAGQM